MPTKHRRIAVTEDEELKEVLERSAGLFAPGTKRAQMVRDLAVHGAEQMLTDEGQRRAALERIAEWSTSEDGIDREALAEALAMRERGRLDAV